MPPSRPPRAATPAQLQPPHFVVGAGASAGGLDAFLELFSRLPLDHMACVVVQHQSAGHKSLLAELLARNAQVEVIGACDGAELRSNVVYVNPADTVVTIEDGRLRLVARDAAPALRHPIDHFFISLAAAFGPRAIGIVLSGTGHDGTDGLAAIKEHGGLTFAQCDDTATYAGMPQSARAQGVVDFAASPRDIAARLIQMAEHGRAGLPSAPASLGADGEQATQLGRLFALVKRQVGVDLADYKLATLMRRIERRMALCRAASLADYVGVAGKQPAEVQAFYDDVLITVTEFFRDLQVFAHLREGILRDLLAARGKEDLPLRLWVAGCATGEEAYSLAMCLAEGLEARKQAPQVQIFATDVSERAIEHARRGVYTAEAVRPLDARLLSRFFVRQGERYQVARTLRDMVVFSRQNLLRDAPFSRIDLVSCRNLLIYLQPPAQQRVLRVLHYALNPDGMLLLGRSETVGDIPDLFALADRSTKLYRKKAHPQPASWVEMRLGGAAIATAAAPPPTPAGPAPTLAALAERKLLDVFAPPCVIVDERGDVVHFRGAVGPYLSPAPGAASFNVLRLARPELRMELKRVVDACLRERSAMQGQVCWQQEGRGCAVGLEALPLGDAQGRFVLLLFRAQEPPLAAVAGQTRAAARRSPSAVRQRIAQLEIELAGAQDYLQRTFEEKESATEELKAANEELQSANEEMQSSNEELETSKEELQSANEELITMNEELQNRMGELGQIHDDLHNLLAGVDVAVIIVGLDLRIRRFSEAARRLFNMVPADLGREVGYVDGFLVGIKVGEQAARVVAELTTYTGFAEDRDGRRFTVTIHPYKTLDHTIRGAVLTVGGAEPLTSLATLSEGLCQHAEQVFAPLDLPLALVDGQCRIVWFSHAAERLLGGALALPLDLRQPDRAAAAGFDADACARLAHALATCTPVYDHPIGAAAAGPRRPRALRMSASCLRVRPSSRLLLLTLREADHGG